MKELLLQYARYNIWANDLIITTMLQLPDGKVDMHISSSFPTIRATTYHCWSAEDLWLQRLMQVNEPIWAESIYRGSFADACYNWQFTSKGLEHFVKEQAENKLSSSLAYNDMRGRPFEMSVHQILHHIFNHATYHRGQLVTMLREAGEVNIPRTDFIYYSGQK